jgi:hypothetical protein
MIKRGTLSEAAWAASFSVSEGLLPETILWFGDSRPFQVALDREADPEPAFGFTKTISGKFFPNSREVEASMGSIGQNYLDGGKT